LDEVDRCVWQLGDRVVWSPHENLLRRLPEDRPSLPSSIVRESDLEPWFKRFIWKHALPFFYDPPPKGFNIVVQNTARVGQAFSCHGFWALGTSRPPPP
jgi:hypothetical protein